MKFKKSLTILSLSLFAAAGLAFTVSASKDAKEVRADSANVYFNIAEFGPTYEADNVTKNTVFSVYAFGNGDAWLEVNKVSGYPNVLVVSADTSYTGFIVVRAPEGVKNTWDGIFNQTSDLLRDTSDTNYYHIGGTDTQYGRDNYSIDIKQTTFSIYEGANTNMPFNFNSEEYEITGVELTPSENFVIKQGDTKFGWLALEDDVPDYFTDALPEEPESDFQYIQVTESGTFAFYLKRNGKIWAQVDPSLEAKEWAEQFVENLGCSDNYNQAPYVGWETYSASFEGLSDGAKDILIEVEASNKEGASFVERAAFMHDMCVAKYGFTVFMKRDGGGSRAINIPYYNNTINFNSTALIITIVSVVTFTSLLALVVFKKNKRKQNHIKPYKGQACPSLF